MLYVKLLVIICSACMLLAGCGRTKPMEPAAVETVQTVPVTEAVVAAAPAEEPAVPEGEAYIPSNTTDYDRQWMLGCESMGWHFGQWMFKLGGLEPSPQRLVLSCLNTGSPGLAALTREPGYYMEVWDGSAWTALFEISAANPDQVREIFTGGEEGGREVLTEVAWDEPLLPGYYRLGAYYTAVLESGESCRQMCYTKFRILEENAGELVKFCQDALKALLDRDAFHILRTDYMLQQRDREDPHYYTQEIFRSGEDYYRDYRYYFYADHSEKSAQASLQRDGQAWYWNSLETPERVWQSGKYTPNPDFTQEAFGLECEPNTLGSISREGNRVTILTPTEPYSFHQEILEQELVYEFDNDGNLMEVSLSYLFADGEKETEIRLEVLDTAREEIRKAICSQ